MSDQSLIETAAPLVPLEASSAVAQAVYADLELETIRELQRTAEDIRSRVGAAYLDVGQRLNRAKALLPHGRFTVWAEAELGMTGRTAENYMRASAFVQGKSETISVLPPATLYKLAAPKAPAEVAEVVERVVAEAAAGVPLDHKAIEQRLAEAKLAAAEIAQARRRSPDLSREEAAARVAESRKTKKLRDERHRRKLAEEEAERERQRRDAEAAWHNIAVRMAQVAEQIAEAAGNEASTLLAALKTYEGRHAFLWTLEGALTRQRDHSARGGVES